MENKKFPINWAVCKLKDIGEIVAGGTPSTNEPSFWGDEISWITPADLSGYKSMFIVKGRKSISKKGLANSSARLVPKGTVLFSSRAPIGYVVIAAHELATNQGFKNIVPYSGIESKYLYYYLIANKQLVEENASGTTFKEISASKFAELPLALPPLSEQNRIVEKLDELLSELEKGKEQLQLALAQLKVYRQAVLKWAFEGRLTENIHNWPRKKLGDVLSFVGSGVTPKGGKSVYQDSGIIFIRSQNVYPQKLVLEDVAYISDAIDKKMSRTRVYPFDVLLNITGASIGRCATVPNDFPKANVNQHVCILRASQDILNCDYLSYFFNSPEGQALIMNTQSGATRQGLNFQQIRAFQIPYPDVKTQIELVEYLEDKLSVCDKIEDSIKAEIERTYGLRQSLLQKAFEGKLVPQDPNDEPASVLLERIKREREGFLKAEKERKKTEKPLHKKRKNMAEELKRLIELLRESTEPVSAKTLWQSSIHKDNIDEFYAALKKHVEAGEIIELPRKGKESFLKLADAK